MVMTNLSSQYDSWYKNSPHPDDQIWFIGFITFFRPERTMTQNGRVTSILICVHQLKNDQQTFYKIQKM